MRRFKVPGGAPDMHAGFSSGEKRRLALLTLGAVFVAAAIGASLFVTGDEPTFAERVPPASIEEEFVETVDVPEIDAARLDALVSDAEPVERVVLEPEALDALLGPARLLTKRHFEAMGARELAPQVAAELRADPAAHRGRAFFARGEVETLRSRRRAATDELEHLGRLRLENGGFAHFVVLDTPDAMIEGDFARLDGLFLKLFSDEARLGSGEWIEAPLLVGPRLIDSYRAFGEVEELDTFQVAGIQDDVLVPMEGEAARISGELPFEPLWHLMAYARDLDEGDVDWEAAPELDLVALQNLIASGASHRCQPFRIPISRLQDARVRRAGENPARIERYTSGWIGNTTWKNVIYFHAPFENTELRLRDYVHGRGFFMMNHAYESADKGLRVAPVFVLSSLEKLPPPDLGLFRRFAWAVAGLTVALIGLFVVLLTRDKRKARELQDRLTERRRSRRSGTVGTAAP